MDVEETGAPILTVKRAFGTSTDKGEKAQSPVGQFSSSLGTTEFAGLHTDAYGDNYETPMQGPFSQEHIGGYQHRHTALNTGTDAVTNRQEAWEIAGGDTFTTRSSMEHPPAYPAYQRDAKAKRPVNVRNIQSTTGSSILGNYQNVYEVVQTSDRNTNNSSFIKNEGFGSASVASDVFPDLTVYAKPTRTKTKHVIVERFSAPGGPETAGDAAGGPFLDLESAQYSPYNNINYRNETVRTPLRTLLTERNEQFGLRSGSSNSETDYNVLTGSIHKTNKNRLQRLSYTNQYTGDEGSAVQHLPFMTIIMSNICSQDQIGNTAWITASLFTTDDHTLGIFPTDGLKSSSAGLTAAATFCSSSDVGSYITAGKRAPQVQPAAAAADSFEATDFVGMNRAIVEPITASSFTLGYPLSVNDRHYYNYGNIGSFAVGTENQDSYIEYLGTDAQYTDFATTLNQVLTHRNGPYGHPTWKQLRVGESQLARHFRKNNLYTHTPAGGEETTLFIGDNSFSIFERYGASLQVSQSVVTNRCKPITHQLLVRTGIRRTVAVDNDYVKAIDVRSTYANNIAYFDINEFTKKVGINVDKGFSSYDQIKKMYLHGALESTTSPVVGVRRIFYSEVVYPSMEYSYTNKVRGRTGYQNNFWRDDRTDRTTLASTKKPNSSMGITYAQSAWALDADENFITNNVTGGVAGQIASGHKAGELQNRYSQFHSGTLMGGGHSIPRPRSFIF